MKTKIERGEDEAADSECQSFIVADFLCRCPEASRLPERQTSNSIRHNQLSQSSKCKTNTSLQTFNKGRNTGRWFIERCKMMRKHSLPRPTYIALAWACYCFGKISFPAYWTIYKKSVGISKTRLNKKIKDIKTGCLPIKALFGFAFARAMSSKMCLCFFIGPRSLTHSLTHSLTNWLPCWRLNELT